MTSRLKGLPLDTAINLLDQVDTSRDDWRSPDFAPNLEKIEFPTVWNVSRYWLHCLEIAGIEPPEQWQAPKASFKVAKLLLAKYEYIDILRAIRWATSPQGIKHFFTLWWLLRDNMPSEVRDKVETHQLHSAHSRKEVEARNDQANDKYIGRGRSKS